MTEILQNVDENDSGNDEPSDGQLSNEKYARIVGQQDATSSAAASNSVQRSLYQRVQELSVSNSIDRPKANNANEDTISLNYMATLPPEGIVRHLSHTEYSKFYSAHFAV